MWMIARDEYKEVVGWTNDVFASVDRDRKNMKDLLLLRILFDAYRKQHP